MFPLIASKVPSSAGVAGVIFDESVRCDPVFFSVANVGGYPVRVFDGDDERVWSALAALERDGRLGRMAGRLVAAYARRGVMTLVVEPPIFGFGDNAALNDMGGVDVWSIDGCDSWGIVVKEFDGIEGLTGAFFA
jgi:hypothetical protein